MDKQLFTLIRSYIDAVARATNLLQASGIKLPTSCADWAAAPVIPCGTLGGGFRYQKHGYGCDVTGDGWSVDFDFGDEGQIDGFDEWRLVIFLTENPQATEVTTIEHLSNSFRAAVEAGEIVYSGRHLYYLKRGPISISQ